MNIVIPMAGLGSRFPQEIYKKPKPFIPVGRNNEPMIECAIESLGLSGNYYFIVNKELTKSFEIDKILSKFMVDPYHIISVDSVTEGPACSALLAKEYINNSESLIVTNCDQIMEWNSLRFRKFLQILKNHLNYIDGAVVTYNVQTEKNSYVKLDENGYATEFAEKKIISEHSLNGIHYWKEGKLFVSSAEAMIAKNIRVNNEFYIAPTYNELILENRKIVNYSIKNEEHWAVGTPEDLQKYLEHANIQTK